MGRKVRTSAEIAPRITEEARRHDGGQDFNLTGVIRLDQPSADGCNWDVLILPTIGVVTCDNAVVEA
jgi:hypothetical protein